MRGDQATVKSGHHSRLLDSNSALIKIPDEFFGYLLNNVFTRGVAAMAAKDPTESYTVTSSGGKNGQIGWIALPNPLANLTNAQWATLAAMLNGWSHEWNHVRQQQQFFDDAMSIETQQQLPKPHGIVLMDPTNNHTVSQVSVAKLRIFWKTQKLHKNCNRKQT